MFDFHEDFRSFDFARLISANAFFAGSSRHFVLSL